MMAHYGREFLYDPRLNAFHRFYIRIFGVPISGLRIRLRRILPRVPSVGGQPNGKKPVIADLGCGKGVFTFELARLFPDAEVVGVDIDAEQVRANRQIVEKTGMTNIRFEEADICALKYESAFDLVVSVDNLEHIQDDVAALRSIHRSLKPGGRLLCHVPAHDRIWLFRGSKTNFDVVGHQRPGYRREELHDRLKLAGFQIRWLEPTYGYLETVSNNLSYLITKAEQKNALAYAVAFPFLNFVAWLGRNQNPGERGAGYMAEAVKP